MPDRPNLLVFMTATTLGDWVVVPWCSKAASRET